MQLYLLITLLQNLILKETGDMGDQNLVENSTTYIIDEKNISHLIQEEIESSI